MKHLTLQLSYHQDLLREFCFWCKIKAYDQGTILELESHIQELLHFIEFGGYSLDGDALSHYLSYLEQRPNYRLSGGLSAVHLNKKSWSLRLFLEYLSMVKQMSIAVHIPFLSREISARKILSIAQIKRLKNWIMSSSEQAIFDSAILGIYYGLGLRRSEGLNLQISAINFRQSLVKIRWGKGGKSRVLPLSNTVKASLEAYLYEERLAVNSPYFFISSRRRKMSRSPIENRLTVWQKILELEWRLTFHTLRHSIATHLLQSGMKINLIQQFLGHQSMLSTQLYTHIKEDERV